MARHYYITRSGRLRRKDNTLYFEPSAEESTPQVEDNLSELINVEQLEES